MALTFDEDQNPTIAAIATGLSESGIGIIRISGPQAEQVIGRVYRTAGGQKRTEWKPGTIHYGQIIEPDSGEKIDEVLVSWMKAPHSYTTEDTAEINTHGGIYVMRKVLSAVLKAGARLAEPGEFTKRAFLGGRIDLSEAEAVMDLIRAGNEFSRRTSLAQLEGSVSAEVKQMREEILYQTAWIESALDDPENYSLDGYPQTLKRVCDSLIDRLQNLLERSKSGRILRDGIRTVIVGKPNAGKSSLLNALTGTDRAIVTEIAGTTRDTLEENVRLGDMILNVTDTAGIHDTEDPVERIGVSRAEQALDSAQLVLFILDRAAGISEEDRQIAGLVSERIREGAKAVVLLNKSDLVPVMGRKDAEDLFRDALTSADPETMEHQERENLFYLNCSMKDPAGLDELKNLLMEMFHLGSIADSDEVFLSGEREEAEAAKALESLHLVEKSIEDGLSEDFYSIDLRNAYAALGRIVGEAVEDDLVEEIFSKFCLGK